VLDINVLMLIAVAKRDVIGEWSKARQSRFCLRAQILGPAAWIAPGMRYVPDGPAPALVRRGGGRLA
jgi:hypothetical protein